jgi:hypothetical protein
MERSLYPNGVLITQADLQRTEVTKANQILRMRTDVTSRGVMTGGAITVNAVNTDRIDVAAFSGYTPRGDYLSASVSNSNVPMSDPTNGIVNYICAIYTETTSRMAPTETGGYTQATSAEASYRIVVYSEVDYLNPSVLTPSDDNLSNDSRDRCLLLGKVVANGSGVALTNASITPPTVMSSSLYPNPVSPAILPGVDIISVDTSTATGTGLLEYQYAAGSYQLRWTSPGGSVGAYQLWTVDDIKNVTDGSGKYLTVSLVASQMPMTGTFPLTASISIIDLYGQAVPRLTAEDKFHRSLRGTGIVTPTNPHGLAPDDIYGQTILQLDEHQDIMHCNGIWKGSLSTLFSGSVTPGAGYDILHINGPSNLDTYYINGKGLTHLDTQDIVFSFPTPTVHMYEVYVSDQEELKTNLKMSYPALPRNCKGTWIINCSKSHTAGSYDLTVVVAGAVTFTYEFSWGDGPTVSLTEGDIDQAIRLYAKDGLNWVDVWARCSTRAASDGNLPNSIGTYTDTITVLSSPSWSTNLLVGTVPYWYKDSPISHGTLGYPSYLGSRFTVDRRSWGTLGTENISDDTLQELVYAPNNEFNFSGVIIDRDIAFDSFGNFEIETSGTSLDVYVSGGHCYCRGKRLTVSFNPALTLQPSVRSLVYVDAAGVLQVINVTTEFSGDSDVAMAYLLGNGADRLATSSSLHGTKALEASPERGVPLYFVDTDGSGVTSYFSVMRNVNKVSKEWSVGLYNASFQTLEAAFYHARNWTTQSSIELTIIGSTIVSNIIDQPANVSVKGVEGNSVSITAVSTTGAWTLSASNIVDGVNFICNIADNIALKCNDSIQLLNCTFDCPTSYILGDNAALSFMNNVVIRNCKFNSICGLSPSNFTPSMRYWKISDNYFGVECTPLSVNYGIRLSLDRCLVLNNIFYLNNSGSVKSYGVGLSSGMYLNRTSFLNNMFINVDGGNNQTQIAILIQDADLRNDLFSGNRFVRTDSSASDTGIGIYISGCLMENVKIKDNIFK